MPTNSYLEILLESLEKGIPAITNDSVGFYRENCLVCFNECGHESGVIFKLSSSNIDEYIEFQWKGSISNQIIRAHADLIQATEFAAYAISLLIIRDTTEYTAVERACIGTTIDYYLAPKNLVDDILSEDRLIFNNTALLEASGILKETNSNSVYNRMNQKLDRLQNPNKLRTFILVVEFSQPWGLIDRL